MKGGILREGEGKGGVDCEIKRNWKTCGRKWCIYCTNGLGGV